MATEQNITNYKFVNIKKETNYFAAGVITGSTITFLVIIIYAIAVFHKGF